MSVEKSTALVLRVTEFSETSCIGMFFTRDFGNLSLIAKGARRPKSPFEAALDVLAVVRVVFVHKSSAMGILTEAKLDRRFRNRGQDLDRLYAAYYVIELLRTLLEEGDPHPELFDLALRTIETLDNGTCRGSASPAARMAFDSDLPAESKSNELNQCLFRFEVGLLRYLGHFPSLVQCVGCGRERILENDVMFGLSAGGILCPKCRLTQTHLWPVSAAGMRYLMGLKQDFDDFENGILSENGNTKDRGIDRPTVTVLRERPTYDGPANETHVPANETRESDLPNGPTEAVCGVLGEMGDMGVMSEVRRLMNHYLAALLGHEPRVMRFLGKLSSTRR